MPKQYEAIRDKLVREGMSYDKAQEHAAKIYNSKHPDAPVTRRDSTSHEGHRPSGNQPKSKH